MTARGLERLRAAHLAGPAEAAPRDEVLCSCGCVEAHPIARRVTADDVTLAIWSDGSITHRRLGQYIRGLGAPRSRYTRSCRVRAVRAVLDDLSLFTVAEIPALVRVAESTFAGRWSSESDRRNWIRIRASRGAS